MVEIDGITYTLYTSSKEAVVSSSDNAYQGAIVISSSVVYGGTTYTVISIGSNALADCTGLTEINIPNSVTSIGTDAFRGCTGLTEINIPNSVTSIGRDAFEGCTGLEIINVADDNTEYSSLDGILYNKDKSSLLRCPEGKQISSFVIPNSVTSIGWGAFYGCTGLTEINIPDVVITIEGCAFYDCTGLTSISIPISVTYIGSSVFEGCTGLTSISLHPFITSIGSSAFAGCTNLTSIDIPNFVTAIENSTFEGCTALTRVVIPTSVKSIGKRVFYGCNNLKELYILSSQVSIYKSDELFGYFGECNTVYAYGNVLDRVWRLRLAVQQEILLTNSYFTISEIQNVSPTVKTFIVKELPGKGNIGTLVRVEYNGMTLSPDASGIYTLNGIPMFDYYTISLVVNINGKEETYQQRIEYLRPQFEFSEKESQTRIELSVNSKIIYPDSKVKEIGVECDGKDYGAVPTIIQKDNEDYYYGKITISNLVPNNDYYVSPYIILDDDTRVEGNVDKFSTKGVSPKIKGSFNGPTAYKAHGSYYLGTATLKDAALYFDGKKYEGNDIYITGLNPDTKYIVEYVVTTNEGSTETERQTITTPALELTTLQPKGVSERCSIVAATTNICDDEPNVGFQWKKYDAPESLKPSEGYAAIYDGQLEGYIKNLQPTSYYKVRAFYKSATDKYYYGDWVTFDPSDFSHFEPTVHTYEATDVTSTSAKVKGYVLAGTDNIIEQGFEYWPVNISQSKAMRVVAAENNVSTIFCTGQVMTATLTDLQPNTTYRFRSFVKTASGMTYGEEQMLTTAYDPTGIGGVETSSSETTVIGYYDINGRKLDGIGNGITIVRYSNGSVRKVVRK